MNGTVPPGSTYKFTFDLAAPATPGTYDELFGVVEDGVAWFSDPGQGGPADEDLEVKIEVVAGTPGSYPGADDAGAGAEADADVDAGANAEGDGGIAPPGFGGPGSGAGTTSANVEDAGDGAVSLQGVGSCATNGAPRAPGRTSVTLFFLALAALLLRARRERRDLPGRE